MLNWLMRYAAIMPELAFDATGALTESVLDVGCGPHGLSTSAPGSRFAGVDLDFPGRVAEGMLALRSRPGPLPFADGAFDTVICLDVLEHVPPGERAGFVQDLARVAARRVLLACPSDEGGWIDDLLRQTYASRGMPLPGWLNEHDEHGLPTAETIAEVCAAPPGFEARPLPMVNGLLSTLAVIADMLPEYGARAAAEFREERDGWLRTFAAARFGSSHRKGYVIERIEARAAVVSADTLDDSVWVAVRCPGCETLGTLALAGADARRCTACGHLAAREPSGAFDLAWAPEVRAPIRTAAGTRLLLAPDWERPETWLPVLAAYVAAGADAEVALCLDAVESPLGVTTVAEMVATVCEVISGGRSFGDVILLDAPYEAALTLPVDGVDALRRVLELPPPAVPSDPGELVERACRGKALLEHVRRIAARRRYELAGDPWRGGNPLVSVRIPTWKGHELLVGRAIPSVLRNTYSNLEVVVCSDGPDPVARAAVEAVGDPRVRYTEVKERPVYPESRWSFWQVAGVPAVHRALDLCRGDFIAPLDHDDAFTEDHIQVLLEAAAGKRADFVYGQALMEEAGGAWRVCGSEPLRSGHISHGTVLYSSRLAHVRLDVDAWLLGEPADWNMWRRISEIGASTCFVPRVVLAHFAERASIGAAGDGDLQRLMARTPEELAVDIERCGLSWLAQLPLPTPQRV